MVGVVETRVVVVGCGAGGAAVAGELSRRGVPVLVAEAGPQQTEAFGSHIRNRDTSELGLAPFNDALTEALVFASGGAGAGPTFEDLKVIHSVGGMFSYWMCNCPIPHPAERAPWIPDEEWDSLLQRVHHLLGVGYDLGAGSARQERMIAQVGNVAGGREPGREVQRMPVAAQRRADGLRFSSVDDLLASDSQHDEPVVRADMICTKVLHSGSRAMGVRLRPRQGGDEIEVRAEIVVVATGTVGTTKLLAGSGVDAGPALGANLFDHPAVGSRVVMRPEILADVPEDDPVFTVWIPYTPDRPWHNQICRFPTNPTAIEYNAGPTETADVFTFSSMEVLPENRFEIDFDRLDPFGLPELVGHYRLSAKDYTTIASGLDEHFRIAAEIGNLVDHRWAPTFFGPGWSTHMMGSCRMGAVDDGTSCVDSYCRLWGYDNLYVAGNAVFSVSNAGNPTPMTIAMGLRTAGAIAQRLQ
jgi:choline dehydrogenase-like flavoprotein